MNTRQRLLLELAKDEPRDAVAGAVRRKKIAALSAEIRMQENRRRFLRRWRAMGCQVMPAGGRW